MGGYGRPTSIELRLRLPTDTLSPPPWARCYETTCCVMLDQSSAAPVRVEDCPAEADLEDWVFKPAYYTLLAMYAQSEDWILKQPCVTKGFW